MRSRLQSVWLVSAWICSCDALVRRRLRLPAALRLVGGSDESAAKAPLGCLIVGLGGNNGVTVLAGLVANRRALSWEGLKRRCVADWTGCVTQRASTLEAYGLARFEQAAVGGWDIKPTRPGDALVEARIVDYDLAARVREEMNDVDVWPGVWAPDYIGETQHATARHVAGQNSTAAEKVELLRRDIRDFKRCVAGHTTVVWSASVEADSELEADEVATAEQLLETLHGERGEAAPPSLLYAVAAALENCSFVNGGSQDTICPGLEELFEAGGGYCLGTDFKAGQTKFKTAAVEYLEAMALRVKVVASSNHLGNNDMYNLMGRKQRAAKLRVKSDVFPTESGIESHTVSVQYTPYIGDEKRDVVEYTSEAFLSQLHTMHTYTRCSDSVLCAPLIVDVCVWCDAFARRGVPTAEARRATAYLFKVPPGETRFFFAQLADLDDVCRRYLGDNDRDFSDAASSAPGLVVCAGVACLDVELARAERPSSLESITSFRGTSERPGGSSPQTATALARLGQPCVVVARIGDDLPGVRLASLLREEGVECFSEEATATGMAIVPIFEAGGRGCYFDPGDNVKLGPDDVNRALEALNPAALHVGYPHLLPSLCGAGLARMLTSAKASVGPDLLVSLDLNGVQSSHRLGDDVLGHDATSVVDVLHANAEEAATLLNSSSTTLDALAAELAARSDAALVAVTDGANGAALVVSGADRLARSALPPAWASTEVRVPAYDAGDASVNANGAGDAFCAGLVAGILRARSEESLALADVGKVATLTAYMRVTRAPATSFEDLVAMLRADDLPPTLSMTASHRG